MLLKYFLFINISTPDSRFIKLVRQAHFVCYIEYFAISNMEEKHQDNPQIPPIFVDLWKLIHFESMFKLIGNRHVPKGINYRDRS